MRELAKSRDPRAVEALRDLLDDPDVFLRYHAARNVLRNPDGFRTIVIRAVEQILAILGNPDRPWRPGWLPPTDREIVDLVKENQDLPAEAFIAALTHSNWEVRKMAARIFSRRDDGHVPVEPFVRALTYDDPNVRRAAALSGGLATPIRCHI